MRPDRPTRPGALAPRIELAPLTRRDAVGGLALGGAALGAYLLTLCPIIFVGDSAELTAAAALFGVPHPPGYPLFTLTTGLLTRLLPVADHGQAANAVSALYAAAAVTLAFLVTRRLGLSAVSCAFGALVLGLGSGFWAQAVAVEVYGFDTMLLLAGMLAALTAVGWPRQRGFLVAGLVVGCWLAHRPVNLLYVPGLLLVLGAGGGVGGALRHWKSITAGLLGAGLAYLYLPIACLREPGVAVGDPSSFGRFWAVLSSAPYHRHVLEGTGLDAVGRLAAYYRALPGQLGVGVVAALAGAWCCWRGGRSWRQLGLGLTVLVLANQVFVAGYHVLDSGDFALPSVVALTLLAAVGAEALHRRLWRGPVATVALVALATLTAPWSYAANDLSEHRFTRQFGEDLLRSVTDEAVLVAHGDTPVHSLWYLQQVERIRPEVIVLSTGHMHAWHLEQLRRRYPDDNWPTGHAADHPGAIVEHLAVRRSIFFDFGATSKTFLQPATYVHVQRGITTQALAAEAAGALDLRERALFSHELLQSSLQAMLPLPSRLHPSEKSLLLSYAVALMRASRLLFGIGDFDRAEVSARSVLALDADRHERELHARMAPWLGADVRASSWNEQVREALDEIERQRAVLDVVRGMRLRARAVAP